MNRRHLVFALASAAALYACAPRSHVAAVDDASPVAAKKPSGTDGLAVTLIQVGDSGAPTFALEVKNGGKRTELRFANGKTHDFVVLDQNDREVWRWSAGRLFTQALQTRQLKPGDSIRYTAKWDSAAPGRYRVVASLNTPTHPEEISTDIVVR